MAYRPDLSDLGAPDSVNRTRHLKFGVGQTIRAPDGRDSRILIRDTWDTDIVNELKPQANDISIYKTRFSRLLRNRSGRDAQEARDQTSYRYGCHHQHMR